ncbi:hypothetical protein, partial [Sphingobacterium hotanense]
MVVIVTALASCGALRNKSKHSEKLEIKESAKVELTQSETVVSSADIKEKEIDKGVIVTEKETTTVTSKVGAKESITIKKGDLKPGENYLPVDSAFKLIRAVLDTLNQTLTIEIETPEEVTKTTVKETTTERKDVTKERQEQKQDTSSKQVATQAQMDRREGMQSGGSESKPNAWTVFVSKIGWGIAILVVLIGVALWLGFRLRK